MKLYNSLTKTIEDFFPSSNSISIYSCGPTVYNNLHIGNLSAFIYADVLRRTLQITYPDHTVRHVMNITDVDDKTIRDSAGLDSDPMKALHALTSKYENVFMNDMQAIGNDVKAMEFIRATESIEDMLVMIHELYSRDIAYIADDGVYFSIEKYKRAGKKYGQLVHIDDSSTASARIQIDEYDKESAHDFALWKIAKKGEPAWKFELDGHKLDGRPGWHIECSAMSRKLLGQPFDIHTGGIDLKFPHHENEIAQSTACSANPTMARFFVHNEHVLVNGKKMSKSLGNFYTLRDLEKKGFEPMAFRLLVLQGHYRNSVSFSWDNLEAAQNKLHKWRQDACKRWSMKDNFDDGELAKDTEDRMQSLKLSLADDIDTPLAIVHADAIFTLVTQYADSLSRESVTSFCQLLDSAFGLNLIETTPDINQEQKMMLDDRHAARVHSDYKKSDELRDQLKEQGIQVLDGPTGQSWYYIR